MQRPDVQNFQCGIEEWATEVADVLVSGQAQSYHRPNSGQFSLLYCKSSPKEDEVIGFAQVKFGKKIGYPNFFGDRIPCLHIANIATSSKHQGQGHFRHMIADLTLLAIEKRQEAIDLLVHKDNQNAIGAYENMDFFWHPNAPLHDDKYRRMILLLS